MNKFIKLFNIFLILFLFTGCTQSQRQISEREKDKEIQKGMAKMISREFLAAKEIFSKIIVDFPDYKEAHYYLGLTNVELKKLDETYINFRTVLELDPEYDLGIMMEIFYIRFTYYNKMDYPMAIREINKFSRLYPKHPKNAEFLLWIADGYRNKGEFDEALKSYRKLINSTPEGNEFRKTAVEMAKFIESNSDFNREPLKLFAQAKAKHTPDDALEIFRTILEDYPKARIIPLVKLEIALCFDHGRMNLFESAAVYYKALIKEYPDSEYAIVAKKNYERIESIFGQKDKIFSDTHNIMKKKVKGK
ncbi:tetratricopeptide repeat protein [Candidatus Desantisbacteria bacterium]|nr:tetratricopeptide repeat protein [Candidatus Desantisbacteria bacterium]